MLSKIKRRTKWGNIITTAFLISVGLEIFFKIMFNSVLLAFLTVFGILIPLVLSPFKSELRYYLFFLFFWSAAFVISFLWFQIWFLFLIAFFALVFSLMLRKKGVPGIVVSSSKDFSVVLVDYDLFSFVKPGYYVIEGKLRKNTRVLIKSVENNLSGLITKYEILQD